MILGTAGHIDHGKTALVRALTGVDTDRLPEEKRRGITIDLGFAPLKLESGAIVGVVDVPGHEAFVRTMLAGASGIDLGLLVIAADEGPMPQTREHLAILELLEVPSLIVALTKRDLVEAEWLALVTEDVRALLASTRYRDARVHAVSAVSGEGLNELRAALDDAGRGARARHADEPFRLPIDRAFSVRGTGTVVTGTVWSGSLSAEDSVRILPGGRSARVRGLQSHGAAVPRIEAGSRAAVALSGVDAESLERGVTLVTDPHWEPALVLRADVTLLPGAPELRPRTRVRFHLATADVGARVIAAGTPVAPASTRAVRIVLDEPVVARGGDRFVIRSASPLATIGGGVVTDAAAPRRARPLERPGLSAHERVAIFAREAGLRGVPLASLPTRAGAAAPATPGGAANGVVAVADHLYAAAALDAARDRVVALVKAHHEQRPLELGVSRQDVRSRLGIDAALFDRLVTDLVAAGAIAASGADLRLAGRRAELSDAQRRIADEITATLRAARHEPPSLAELEPRFGAHTVPVLKHLEREGRVVQVEDTRYYDPDAVKELLTKLERGMAGKDALAPTELRELLGFSRKFLIPFLEYCDRRGYTARQGNGRVWRGVRTS